MTKKILAVMLGLSVFSTTVQGAPLSTRDLVEDSLEAESLPPEEAFLCNTTAYIHGDVCCRGVKAREGIVAAAPEWYGMSALIYEAVEEDGEYEMGQLLGIFEILDTGYGKSTGDGVPSKVRADKKSRGTIETGQCIDVFKSSYKRAKEWMKTTGGRCYVQIIDAKG